jgi:hypothetical protein
MVSENGWGLRGGFYLPSRLAYKFCAEYGVQLSDRTLLEMAGLWHVPA